MKRFFLRSGGFLALALLVVNGVRGDVATSDPTFELSNAVGLPVKVKIRQNNGRDQYMVLPNDGVIKPGERWRLSLTPTGNVKGVRNLKTRTYYEILSITVTTDLPGRTIELPLGQVTSMSGGTIVGERQRNFNEVKERENGMSWSGSNKFYIVLEKDGRSLRIVKLVQ